MNDLQDAIEFLRRNVNISTVVLLITWAGIAWIWYRKRKDWSRKQFLHQINFSVSYVADGLLTTRTLMETSAQQVWLNEMGVRQVTRAAARTTTENPFVTLADASDMAFVYRAVLNVLSEKFADAYLAQSMGLPVRFTTYRFAVTCERFADIRTLKIRVILISDADIKATFAAGQPVEVPNAYYIPRLNTLRLMADLFARAEHPGVLQLGRVILGLRM